MGRLRAISSMTETSKYSGAWFAMTVSGVQPKVSSAQRAKSITPRCGMVTPLGSPVEPEVYMTYTGSESVTAATAASTAAASSA